MPLTNILEVELFDVWGIDFMRHFPPSFSNLYIFVVIDYVSKYVEAVALPTNDAKTVVKFLQKNIFSRFGTLRDILVMKEHIFATKHLLQHWLNMESSIRLLQNIIHKQVTCRGIKQGNKEEFRESYESQHKRLVT